MRWLRCGAWVALGMALTGLSLGCGGEGGTAPRGDAPPEPPILSQDVSSHCFRWPEATFTKRSFAEVATAMGPGDLAVDFEAEDIEGNPYRLSELLVTKPVLLVLGSFT